MAKLNTAAEAFIKEIGPLASADMRESGILASLTLAQAILESGWGVSALSVIGNALFGIKAGASWTGKVYDADTNECYDGKTFEKVRAVFRAYESWADSIRDHSLLLTGNARYSAVVGERDYKAACHAIQAAGYATDPQYAEKLIQIIETNGLTAYDGEAVEIEEVHAMTAQEMRIRQRIVTRARSYLGSPEGGAKHREILSTYNNDSPLPRGYKMTDKDAWCATFVSAMAIMEGFKDIIPKECSCSRMIALFKEKGRWQEDDAYIPNPGDEIFYDWQDGANYAATDNRGAPDHVGIVAEVANGRIHVIEGNYKDAVTERVLNVNGRYIRGYGIPDYASLCTEEEQDQAAQPTVEVMRAGAKVSYTGPIYKTSDGTGKGKNVSGTFPVKYYSPGKKCGVHIGDMGWVSEYACNIVE